jgi:hypothetical protein
MHARIATALAATFAIALILAGCGGSDSTASSLTKAQFIKQADAICAKTDKAVLAAISEAGVGERKVLIAGLQPVQKEAEEISALGAPSGDEEAIAAIVAGIEAAVRKAENTSLPAAKGAFAKVDALSAKYGFDDCAKAL